MEDASEESINPSTRGRSWPEKVVAENASGAHGGIWGGLEWFLAPVLAEFEDLLCPDTKTLEAEIMSSHDMSLKTANGMGHRAAQSPVGFSYACIRVFL